jgi:type IV secretion system protein VirB1
MEMMACPNLAVPAEVMQHVVNVESSRNPFAIGVVGAQLVRQPQNLPEAVATVRMLEEKGYNFSLGVAQVNRANFGKYGLDSYEKAFDVCPNLVAGSQILAQCYASAGGDWGKAFSCYYSGNFTTGYQDGYVQKVFASMARQPLATSANPIPIQLVNNGASKAASRGTPVIRADEGAYRVAMRSLADTAMSAALTPAVAAATGVDQPVPQPLQTAGLDPAAIAPYSGGLPQTAYPAPGGPIATDPATAAAMAQAGARLPTNVSLTQSGRIPTDAATAAAMAQIGVSSNRTGSAPASADDSVFVPEVHGPNDPPAAAAAPVNATPVVPGRDQADLRQGASDGAFVF